MSESTAFEPRSLSELDMIMSEIQHPVTFFAGATDLMVRPNEWRETPALINLLSVHEMRQTIESQKEGVLIGAAVPLSGISAHPVVRERFPILVEACRQIGSVQIQNRASLGGNIANASPAGDSLPVLSVLNAELWIGPEVNGTFQKLLLEDVMTGPGRVSLTYTQYIAYIFLPFYETENSVWAFRKIGQRHALAISKLSLAVLGHFKANTINDIRISAGSVSPQIRRAKHTEAMLSGKIISDKIINQAGDKLKTEISPITDIRSDADYRRDTCGLLLKEVLYSWKSKS